MLLPPEKWNKLRQIELSQEGRSDQGRVVEADDEETQQEREGFTAPQYYKTKLEL